MMIQDKITLYIKNVFSNYQPQLKSLSGYWNRLSDREKQLLMAASAAMVLFFSASILSSTLSLQDRLSTDFTETQKDYLKTNILYKQYTEVSQISANEFSKTSQDRIRGDAVQVLATSEPDVTIVGDKLTVNVDSAKFMSIMMFLDQLRNSYGLFPAKLKITRLSQSGYASLNASFIVEQE